MGRQACVDLAAFPLQLQLLQKPEWRCHPSAVVDEDKPQGKLLWINRLARQQRILPGMRYASALALCRDLRAAEMPAATIQQAIDGLIDEVLTAYSPRVEAAAEEPGVFWLDLSGLERLFPDLNRWAEDLQDRLQRKEFVGRVVVGWDRFATYALAKGVAERIWISPSRKQERRLAARVRLADLGVEPQVRDALKDLGIRTLGEFAALPREGIERRFGESARALHQQVCGEREPPLQPQEVEVEIREQIFLEESVRDLTRLLNWIEALLSSLLAAMTLRSELTQEIDVELRLERGEPRCESMRTAEPTNDLRQWLELLSLRFDGLRLQEGAEEIILSVRGKHMRSGQMDLFTTETRRDLAAANRALARVRAELGESSVQKAELRAGHLPEGQFEWRSFEGLAEAKPPRLAESRLVRRFLAKPMPLPPRPRREPDGWLLRGLADSPVDRVKGPFVVAGGWWRRAVHREYHFAETRKGDILWIFFDRLSRRWFLHGKVE